MRTDIRAYLHPSYVGSLAGHGSPRRLTNSGGWILEREIPGSHRRDAMGPYPVFCCDDWHGLAADLDELRDSGFVSVVAVTDPMLDAATPAELGAFDVARPFKTHYLTDLTVPSEQAVSGHHRSCVRRAARKLDWDRPHDTPAHLEEWCALYEHLAARHAITGLRRFSVEAFRAMLALPGAILMRALYQGKVVGAQLFLIHDNVAHAHLAAFDETGYRLGASYLLDWAALDELRHRVRYINWGGGAGLAETDTSGLAQYKQGWATDRRITYLLGSILDRAAYNRLTGLDNADSSYFPAYRTGEFG